MGVLQVIWNDIKAGAIVVEEDVKKDFESLKAEVVADVDALVTTLTPYAIQGAKEIEQAVADGSLMASEKRSALVTKLESQVQSAGYSLEQQGISAAINLALEFGVNLFKMLVGQAVGAPTP